MHAYFLLICSIIVGFVFSLFCFIVVDFLSNTNGFLSFYRDVLLIMFEAPGHPQLLLCSKCARY